MTTAVILAAGMGTRMRSTVPKALHQLGGKPMLWHLVAACEEAFDRIVVVVGPGMEAVARAAAPHQSVVQVDRLGTAHAALQAVPLLGRGDAAVLYADNPLVRAETLRALLARRAGGDARLALLAMRPRDPAKYGRVIADASGAVERVVEWADADEGERAIGLCNAGAICADAADLARWLRGVRNDNAKGEYYLTDVVSLAFAEGARVVAVEGPEAELRGVNSPEELAEAEATLEAMRRSA